MTLINVITPQNAPGARLKAGESDLFLAGGIATGADDWRAALLQGIGERLSPDEQRRLTVVDPTNTAWDASFGDTEVKEQIAWEASALDASRAAAFHFTSRGDQPLTMFELGAFLGARDGRLVFASVERGYSRAVELRAELATAGVRDVHGGLDSLADAVAWYFRALLFVRERFGSHSHGSAIVLADVMARMRKGSWKVPTNTNERFE